MKTKSFVMADLKALGDGDGPGEFEAILSTDAVDRDGEVVEARCFEPLPDHITIDVDHGLTTQTTVGSGVPFYDGDTLKVKGTFSSIARAQDVRTLVVEGHVRTMSVAFMRGKKKMVDGVPHVTKAELLNAAIVSVPSQRDALITSAKGGARNSAADQEHLDAAHAHIVAAGATCTPADDADDDDAEKAAAKSVRYKTVAGSYEQRQETLENALEESYDDSWWVRLLATTDTDVTYQVYGGTCGGNQYRCTYAIGDDGAVTLGEAEQVQLIEIVQPIDSTEDPTTSGKTGDATGAADAALVEDLEIRARGLRILHDTVA